jgi:hypothetical protein
MKRIALRDHISDGPNGACRSYLNPTNYASCLDVQARKLPVFGYGLSAQWVRGTLYGKPWSGCAAGMTHQQYVFASLAQPSRTLDLIAWESANHFLKFVLDRADLTDGALVGEASNAAKAACTLEE